MAFTYIPLAPTGVQAGPAASASARRRNRSIAASTAKTWCSDAGRRVMASALQVHGGIGFTWEHDLHFHLKRAVTGELLFGTSAFHRTRVAELLGLGAA